MGRARSVKVRLEAGQRRLLRARLCLWGNVRQLERDPVSRAVQIVEQCGARVLQLRADVAIAHGYKAKRRMNITLPVADVAAVLDVRDPVALGRAWRTGMGRGRRFGFGMPLLE